MLTSIVARISSFVGPFGDWYFSGHRSTHLSHSPDALRKSTK
jgi:hypothetical protein